MILTINIPAILIANAMGIVILFVVAISSFDRLKEPLAENKCILIIFFSCLMNCIVDPICFLADGKPGVINRILVIGCNSLLYLGGAIIGFVWVFLVTNKLKTKIAKVHNIILYAFFDIIVLLLIINIFVPILFLVDSNNVYTRLTGYWIYTIFYGCTILDGLIVYISHRKTSGGLKFFPVWAFLIPTIMGIIIQTLSYGVSTANPFITISIVAVMLCLQNEFMIRDKLTGLYNRFFLNTLEKRKPGYKNLKYTAIMLDINEFKKINDTYGHKVGDEALILLSSVLTENVGKFGEVIRFAGDEFIVILNTQDEMMINKITTNIKDKLDLINKEALVPYKLKVAMGYSKINFADNTLDEYLDRIDKLMYEDKKLYYETHMNVERSSEKYR